MRASWAPPSPNSSMCVRFEINCIWPFKWNRLEKGGGDEKKLFFPNLLVFSDSYLCLCFQAVFWRDVSLQLPDRNWKHTQPKKPAERAVMSCKLMSSHCIIRPVWSFLVSALPLNCWRGSCRMYAVLCKGIALGHSLNVWKSSVLIVVQGSPKTSVLQARYS